MVLSWNVTAKRIEGYLFDVFVNDRFYRRVSWNGVRVTKDERIPCGSPIYFPSITEIEQACNRA